MRMVVSNSAGKTKLKYDGIKYLILVEEVRKDSDEFLGSGSALNVDNRGKSNRRDDKNSNWGRSKSRHKGKSRPHSEQTVR